MDNTRVTDPIVSHFDANGRRLVIIRGDLRVLGEIEGSDGAELIELQERVAALEEKLRLLTEP